MKILVTGATGFVGNYFIKELNRDDVSILSRKHISGRKVYVGDLFNKIIIFTDYYQQLEKTSKRLEKTYIISQLLKEVKKEDNPEYIINLIRGRVFLNFF